MSKPFDATLKDLIQSYPGDFLAALDEPATGLVEALNVDLSTLTAASDVVLRRADGEVVHFELQSGPDLSLPRRALLYNAVLFHREAPPAVHTIVVLLRPKADHFGLNGVVRCRSKSGHCSVEFHYEVVRVWQRPMEAYLQGGVGTLPLAVLGRPPEGQSREAALPAVIRRIVERLVDETPADLPKMLAAAYVLAGLRLAKAQTDRLFRGIPGMQDSTTYQGILDDGREGRLDEARKLLVRLARKRFNCPNAEGEATLAAITDLEKLERLGVALMVARSWTGWLRSS
jgi:predicted transposase YdaD